jgi:hypothetical protein
MSLKKLFAAVHAHLAPAGWDINEDEDAGLCGFTSPYSPSVGADICSNHIDDELPENEATLLVRYNAWGNWCDEATFEMSEFNGRDAQKALARALAEAVVSASRKDMLARIEQADPFAAEREQAARAERQARTQAEEDSDPRKAELDEIVKGAADRFNTVYGDRLQAMHADPFQWNEYSKSYKIAFPDDAGFLSIAAVYYVPEEEDPQCYVLVSWQDREDHERRECQHGTFSQDDLLAFLNNGLQRIEKQG